LKRNRINIFNQTISFVGNYIDKELNSLKSIIVSNLDYFSETGQIPESSIGNINKSILTGIVVNYVLGYTWANGKILSMKVEKGIESAPNIENLDNKWNNVLKYIWNKYRDIIILLLTFGISTQEVDYDDFYMSPSDYTKYILKNVANDLTNSIVTYINQSCEKLTPEEIRNNIDALFDALKETKLRKIYRTEFTRAFNLGVLEKTYSSDEVIGYKFVAVLDDRTTEMCRVRNGLFIPKDDVGTLAENTPPLHVNCRSSLEVITIYDKNIPNKITPNIMMRYPSDVRDEDRTMILNLLSGGG
jgi:SPP1 gp7 family putative phage head morphogenesis protein